MTTTTSPREQGQEPTVFSVRDSLLNRAVYYWEYYQISGFIDYLEGAYAFMADYRAHGGTERPDLWESMQRLVNPVAA